MKARQRAERQRALRRRTLVLILSFVVLIGSAGYLLVMGLTGQIFVGGSKTVAVTQPPITVTTGETTDEPSIPVTYTGSGNTGENASNWTYTTAESMPAGNIVDGTSAFYDYERVRRDLYFLEKRYDDCLTVNVFGYSADGRELLDAVVGSPTATKDVIVQYGMHAREYLVVNVAMMQLERLLVSYHSGTVNGRSISDVMGNVRLHIIPMMNPDGIMLSETQSLDVLQSEELKNIILKAHESDLALGKASPSMEEYLATWKANARCVDLNRNFATTGWTTEMGTQTPSCSRYPGSAANSEPEVQALLSLVDSINCVAQIAYHAHGEMVYFDYGMEEIDPALHDTDHELAQRISAATAVNGAEPYEVISTVLDDQNPGGCSDYFMQILHKPAVTVEVAAKLKPDGSYNDPPLSLDQVAGVFERNADVLPVVAEMFA
ncbi:MAG: M14 family zinc carboxypeptidase [Lachnospiraceae bacterium]|nr:M14 family zinc carboxypeptidase [Lachnospiraceae bacterium]